MLDALGEIIYFPELEWLDEFLLNPRWLTYGVYPLLYSPLLRKQNGRISKQDVAEILRNRVVTDNQGFELRYPSERQHLLLHAMEQFKLCYPAPDDPKNAWIVPDLLPSDQPDPIDFDDTNALRFDFDFKSFLPRHVLAMFIVEQHEDIWNNQVWQHGVVLRNKRWHNTSALVRADYQARVLSLEISGHHVDKYFSVLFECIEKILERMPKLPYVKLLYLDASARLDGGFLAREEGPAYADFEEVLAQQASGAEHFVSKFGRYDFKKILSPVNRYQPPPKKADFEPREEVSSTKQPAEFNPTQLFVVVFGMITLASLVLVDWQGPVQYAFAGTLLIALLWFVKTGLIDGKDFLKPATEWIKKWIG